MLGRVTQAVVVFVPPIVTHVATVLASPSGGFRQSAGFHSDRNRASSCLPLWIAREAWLAAFGPETPSPPTIPAGSIAGEVDTPVPSLTASAPLLSRGNALLVLFDGEPNARCYLREPAQMSPAHIAPTSAFARDGGM